MDNENTVQQNEIGIIIPPSQVLDNARTAAKALSDVISKKAKPVMMNGEQYLEFEDWQTVGQFYGYTVRTGDAVACEIDGVKGAKAHADLINFRTGQFIGGAEAYCMRDEPKWSTRTKYEYQGFGRDRKRVKVGDEPVPWFQLASMAQTRAGAKALRNRLAWVVVLAGYRPTPAEELPTDDQRQTEPEQDTAKPAVASVVQKEAPAPSGGGNDKGEAQKLQRDPSTIKNATELFKACSEDWPDKFKSTKDVNAALGIKAWLEWGGTVAEAYTKIAGVMQK